MRLLALPLLGLLLVTQACDGSKSTGVTPDPQADPVTALHDIWVLDAIAGQSFTPEDGSKRPTLELNLTDMRAFGTDGCNDFTGAIREATPRALAFGSLAGTKKMCATGMATADAFKQALAQTVAYRRQGLRLTLLDDGGQSLMTLRKVD